MAKRKFCDAGCRASYHADRQQGLIYGMMAVPRARVAAGVPYQALTGTLLVGVSWDVGCAIYGECLYCRADLSDKGAI
jgi:hypothetical protein